jgi:uncharacterized membrane protein YhhN
MALSLPAIVLSACAVLSAGLTIWADRKGRRGLFQRIKPLTTSLIIAVAAVAPVPEPAAYKIFILAGLVASLAGDIALALPEKWFATGLAAFLVAQVLYIMAFRPGPTRPVSVGIFLPFILYGLLIYFILRPGLGPLKLPVFAYVGAIIIMAGFAASRYVALGGLKPLFAFVGAVLFLISDSVLAYDRFGRKLGPAVQIVILGTYFPAQLLIALSV